MKVLGALLGYLLVLTVSISIAVYGVEFASGALARKTANEFRKVLEEYRMDIHIDRDNCYLEFVKK